MESVERGFEAEGSFDYPFYNGNPFRPYLLTLVSKEDVDRKMDIKIYLLMEGDIYQGTELDIVGKITLALALKKNQFDFIKKWGEDSHIWENMIRIDIRSRGQFKWKYPFITFC